MMLYSANVNDYNIINVKMLNIFIVFHGFGVALIACNDVGIILLFAKSAKYNKIGI